MCYRVQNALRSFQVYRDRLRVCFHFAKICKDVNMAFEVLNEVYLQNFLHRWVVNREMNLMMLINPCLINN